MKKTIALYLVSGVLSMFSLGVVHAEEASIFPLETFTCNYKKGKDAGDLAKVNDKWNAWTDKSSVPEYAAWVLTPFFVGAEIKFDLGWLGGWPDGNAMGKSIQEWMTKGKDLQAAYNDVVDCDSHSNFAAMVIQSSAAINETSVLSFSDCKIDEGHSMDQAMGALAEWGRYLSDSGDTGGAVVLFPAYGTGDVDYDFKWMRTFSSFETFGSAYEQFGNGGGYQKSGEMLDGLLSCDVGRVYTVEIVRAVQPDQE